MTMATDLSPYRFFKSLDLLYRHICRPHFLVIQIELIGSTRT